MKPIHQLRIQVVLLSDDDGANGATVTPAGLTQRVEAANTIYAPAGVTFLFEPATDVLQIRSTLLNRDLTVLVPPNVGSDGWSSEPSADTDSHHRARAAFARIFARRIIVFCRPLTQLKKVDSTWKIAGKPNNSSWARYYIDLSKGGAGLTTLAHELGHYLQIRHTFSAADTVAEAAAAIKSAVDAGTLSASEGLQALDADRVWVRDTAADCAPAIFSDAGVSPCGQDSVAIDVALNGTTKTYTLQPDQMNLMSYHDCSGTKTVSAGQTRRMRDGLEIGMRHRLVSLRSTGREAIVKRSSAAAGAIGRFDVVAVRSGCAVTAVSDSANNLKVIAWDVSDSGAITRRGDASGGTVAAVSSCAIGLGMLATAVGTATGLLKVILWKLDDAANVTRKGDAVGAKCGEVEVCRVGIEHLATASRRENGNLGVDLWRVTAAGQVAHVAAAEAGAIGEAQPAIAVFPVGSHCFATSVRDAGGEAATILWNADDDTLTRLNKLDYAAKASWVRGCAVDREVGVTAILDLGGKAEAPEPQLSRRWRVRAQARIGRRRLDRFGRRLPRRRRIRRDRSRDEYRQRKADRLARHA